MIFSIEIIIEPIMEGEKLIFESISSFLLYLRKKVKKMDNPVTHRELDQFRDLMESENERLKEENDRQNHRIGELEDSVREISNLAASTEKLAANMENMLKVQEQQSCRLDQIESRDGEKWRKAMTYIGTAILGAVLAIIFSKIGL